MEILIDGEVYIVKYAKIGNFDRMAAMYAMDRQNRKRQQMDEELFLELAGHFAKKRLPWRRY